jgi:hypothetical protein
MVSEKISQSAVNIQLSLKIPTLIQLSFPAQIQFFFSLPHHLISLYPDDLTSVNLKPL